MEAPTCRFGCRIVYWICLNLLWLLVIFLPAGMRASSIDKGMIRRSDSSVTTSSVRLEMTTSSVISVATTSMNSGMELSRFEVNSATQVRPETFTKHIAEITALTAPLAKDQKDIKAPSQKAAQKAERSSPILDDGESFLTESVVTAVTSHPTTYPAPLQPYWRYNKDASSGADRKLNAASFFVGMILSGGMILMGIAGWKCYKRYRPPMYQVF